VNATLERKYGAFVRSRRKWKQFRELTIVCLTHSGNSAETHPFRGGRKRVRSVKQTTDYNRADSPTFLNYQAYI